MSKNTQTIMRAETIRAVAAMGAYEPVSGEDVDNAADCAEGEPGRYLLVETGAGLHDDRRWFSTFDEIEEAIDYHQDQEYAEDWGVLALIDLDTREIVEGRFGYKETGRSPLSIEKGGAK